MKDPSTLEDILMHPNFPAANCKLVKIVTTKNLMSRIVFGYHFIDSRLNIFIICILTQ